LLKSKKFSNIKVKSKLKNRNSHSSQKCVCGKLNIV
jgi:hypothetical protein